MAQDMTLEEVRQFLMAGTRTGKLATVRPDGRPHVVPVWFLFDDHQLFFTTWHETVKAANLRHDKRVSFCVDDQQPPFSFVMIEGRAEIQTDLEELRKWATRIAGRYMGADQAESFGERNSVAGELLVRVSIEHIVAKKNMAD